MAASFSLTIAPSALSCCLRHSTLRVRPLAKVARSRATVAGMSGATGAGTAGAVWGIESVVMVDVLPDPRRSALCSSRATRS